MPTMGMTLCKEFTLHVDTTNQLMREPNTVVSASRAHCSTKIHVGECSSSYTFRVLEKISGKFLLKNDILGKHIMTPELFIDCLHLEQNFYVKYSTYLGC